MGRRKNATHLWDAHQVNASSWEWQDGGLLSRVQDQLLCLAVRGEGKSAGVVGCGWVRRGRRGKVCELSGGLESGCGPWNHTLFREGVFARMEDLGICGER